MKSHDKALSKKKGKDIKGVNNLVKGNEGNVGKNDKKVAGQYKFNKFQGAKNNDSENDD